MTIDSNLLGGQWPDAVLDEIMGGATGIGTDGIKALARQLLEVREDLLQSHLAWGKDNDEWSTRCEKVERERDEVRASLARFINAPPAQMSWQGRLVNIDSTGMREVIDAHGEAVALLREMLDDPQGISVRWSERLAAFLRGKETKL